MHKNLLILENDPEITRSHHSVVSAFLHTWDGDVIPHVSLHHMEEGELRQKLRDCTDIVCQTSLIQDSDWQFDWVLSLLARIPEPKNIYLTIHKDLNATMRERVKPKEFFAIKQHTIFDWIAEDEEEYYKKSWVALDFTDITDPIQRKIDEQEALRANARSRPTGRKVKVLGCVANGKAFENLPIGEVVDELDMSMFEAQDGGRGLWIWGNGEPIKLVNDTGFKEFELVISNIDDLFEMIDKDCGANIKGLKRIEIKGLETMVNDPDETPHSIANFICEEIGIPKRHNRQVINNLVAQYKKLQ